MHEGHKALRLRIFVPFVVDKIAADQKRHLHAVHGISNPNFDEIMTKSRSTPPKMNNHGTTTNSP